MAWIALVIAILLIVSFIISAVGSFNFGAASPTPRPATVQTFLIPTPTVTPIPQANVQEPEPTPTLEPTSTPIPTHTPTPEPTTTSTPSPTPTPIAYIIQKLGMESVRASKELVVVDFSVDLKNIRGLEGAGSVPFQMAIDGGEPELVHIITGFDPGEEASFVFARELTPGSHTVTFLIGEIVIDDMSIDVKPAGVLLIPTSTAAPTNSPTPEPTVTPITTPEPTETPIQTSPSTTTPTPEPTLAQVPPNTPTPEPTVTATPSTPPTATGTLSVAATPSPTPTVTATPSAMPTATASHHSNGCFILSPSLHERPLAGATRPAVGLLHQEAGLDTRRHRRYGVEGDSGPALHRGDQPFRRCLHRVAQLGAGRHCTT